MNVSSLTRLAFRLCVLLSYVVFVLLFLLFLVVSPVTTRCPACFSPFERCMACQLGSLLAVLSSSVLMMGCKMLPSCALRLCMLNVGLKVLCCLLCLLVSSLPVPVSCVRSLCGSA